LSPVSFPASSFWYDPEGLQPKVKISAANTINNPNNIRATAVIRFMKDAGLNFSEIVEFLNNNEFDSIGQIDLSHKGVTEIPKYIYYFRTPDSQANYQLVIEYCS
jgi:DNA-binding transcriptional MerR regulator